MTFTAGGGAGGCGQGQDSSGGCTGATGGSGVVILSYAVNFRAATTTGKF